MVEFRKEDTWTDGKYEYERLPRHRLPPREIPPDGEYQRMVNIVQKRPPDEEGYNRYEDYSDSEFRDYEECYANERKSGFPYRDDPAYRWRGEPHMSRQLEYRESKDAYKKKPYYHPNICPRERSPHRRDSPFVRDSPVTRKDSPHSRSGSSVSSRSYSPERGKSYPFHQHRRSKEQSCTHPSAVSPTSSAAIPPTKAGSSSALHGDQIAELEANVSGNSEFHDANPHTSRSRAIAAKTKEIEEVYRQDCETFGMVVKMLIDKDSTLEKQIQFSLRQNLSEIGERCIEELKMYITEYDAHQELV
ncbi:periphilin 1 S homeolog isoform X3 [Xenopus laevis]|uniref:Periphilin 1 S homeolog isoform X3 n=1 Tax=Xenopus laevis TaxID=8355 RepID=A0A8J1MQ55_XENLA|nr:periphilin 1 S homeolog isoform X3 [Xenopus laevis]